MKTRLARMALALLLIVTWTALTPADASATITQRFKTTEPLLPGSLVSLSSKPQTVAPATSANLDALYGIAISVSGSDAEVATSEVVPVMVDSDNGDITANSAITVSFLKGIGAKATSNTRIVGFAQATCSKTSPNAKTTTVKDNSGTSHTVAICVIPVLLGVAYYSPASSTAAGNNPDSFVPPGLQHIFSAVAGHEVVASKIMLALVLLLVVVVIVGVLAGTSVHSSLVSIGRNPLAKGHVLKGLIQVGLAVVGLMGGALAGVYFIITH